MAEILTFRPRPNPAAAAPIIGASPAEIRTQLEQAAQVALDAADRIIAVLDRMDGEADDEDTGDAEPSLAAPENPEGSQVGYMRGNDQDCEADAREEALPGVACEDRPTATVLPWCGRGNVVAAAGVALLSLVERNHRQR